MNKPKSLVSICGGWWFKTKTTIWIRMQDRFVQDLTLWTWVLHHFIPAMCQWWKHFLFRNLATPIGFSRWNLNLGAKFFSRVLKDPWKCPNHSKCCDKLNWQNVYFPEWVLWDLFCLSTDQIRAYEISSCSGTEYLKTFSGH